MQEKILTVVSSGPDWVTTTSTDHDTSLHLLSYGTKLLAEADEKGDLTSPWKGLGYLGRQSKNIRVGVRNGNEAIMMASGPNSLHIAENTPSMGSKVTRFDLQVTIAVEPADPTIAAGTYDMLAIANARRLKPRYIKLIRSETGETLYVGKRTNNIMLRLYDKTDAYDTGKLGSYWRYEVEYKGNAAQKAHRKWFESGNRAAMAVSMITSEFSKRGIEPGFHKGSRMNAIAIGATASTAETKIDWLIRCVSPVVVQLCMSGYEDQVLRALNLKNFIVRKESKDGDQ